MNTLIKCRSMRDFTWVFTACKSTCLGFSVYKGLKCQSLFFRTSLQVREINIGPGENLFILKIHKHMHIAYSEVFPGSLVFASSCVLSSIGLTAVSKLTMLLKSFLKLINLLLISGNS